MAESIELGNRVRCIVSGFQGIATARIEYLNGCVQIGIRSPVDKDGKESDVQYIDIGQVEYIDEGVRDRIVAKATGGVMRDAPSAGIGLSR